MKRISKKHHVWISLGGNLNNILFSMRCALQQFNCRDDCSVIAVSSVYKTPPWGKTDQPWFLNACARLETVLDPNLFLQLCLDIEQRMGRKRGDKWGPRTLDIDILFYENLQILIPGRLIIPHPEIANRGFILVPLMQISPELQFFEQSLANLVTKVIDNRIIKLTLSETWWKA